MYDTLRYAKELEQAGFSRAQSEAQVKVLKEMVMDGVATKTDLERVEMRLSQGLSDVQVGTKTDLERVEMRLRQGLLAAKADLEQSESRLNQKMNGLHGELALFRGEVNHEISLLRSEMNHGFSKMVIRFGGMNIVGFTLLVAVLQWLK